MDETRVRVELHALRRNLARVWPIWRRPRNRRVLRSPLACACRSGTVLLVLVYAVCDLSASPDHPLGDAVDVFVRREDAEQFIEQVQRDDPELARRLRIVERELKAGERN